MCNIYMDNYSSSLHENINITRYLQTRSVSYNKLGRVS